MAFPQQQQTFSGGGGGLPPDSPPDIMDLIVPQGVQQSNVIPQGELHTFLQIAEILPGMTSAIWRIFKIFDFLFLISV